MYKRKPGLYRSSDGWARWPAAIYMLRSKLRSILNRTSNHKTDPATIFDDRSSAPLLFCAVTISLALAYELWVSTSAPLVPNLDGVFFYPVYLSVAENGVLSNPILSPIVPTGGGPFVWHGWLQPLLLGHLTRWLGANFPAALLAESLIVVVGLSLYVINSQVNGHDTSLGGRALGAIIILAALTASKGRPELLAAVLLMMWITLDHFISNLRAKYVVAGLFLCLLIITQPTVALISALLFLFVLLLRHADRESGATWIGVTAGAAVFAVLLLTVLCPFSLLDWLQGLYQQAQMVRKRTDVGGFVQAFITNPGRPLHGLVLFTAAAWMIHALMREPRRLSLVFVSLSIIALFWYLGVRVPALAYNILVFVPAIVLVGQLRPELVTNRSALVLSFVSICSAAALLFGFVTALFAASRDELIARSLDLREQHARIAVDPLLLVGGFPLSSWNAFQIHKLRLNQPRGLRCGSQADFYVFRQANTGLFVAPSVSGCQLVFDGFSRSRPSLMGWEIPLVSKGYGFAIYKRTQ